MPKMSDTMTEGTIAAWHKQVGDKVKSGDIIAEVETDKATMELDNYVDGVLLHIGIKAGESIPVDGVIFCVDAGYTVGSFSCLYGVPPSTPDFSMSRLVASNIVYLSISSVVLLRAFRFNKLLLPDKVLTYCKYVSFGTYFWKKREGAPGFAVFDGVPVLLGPKTVLESNLLELEGAGSSRSNFVFLNESFSSMNINIK